ncbi:glycosyltransferase [Acinetobacter nosocomialis]|uniref:glycosyltransferase n=1 Tax=Acinetobacter nosocomialis TaxID=106654 RepID=UPI00057C9D6D|nr:glycosyltransferase [Acinetobacter nosocomialis]AJB49854.1 amylovoran biosynthesis protein AmsE [Acinetobacter nosocomialis]MBR7740139.1 glycosyltransferase [Acinetobacter nosocomialis]MDO7216232.1 glycosyltransferase [Acinetobacter nosocomialis]MDO7438025.1 glycosyltransferase [Acinetobacter nosocomialis]
MNFSVLMSLYYKENVIFLDECFKSIWLNQEVKPNEIVLILDGPIGEDLQNCVQYWTNQIGPVLKVIPLPHNVGLGKALNEGIKHCSNEWVFRMDTDDICTSDRFEKQLAFIEQNPDVVLFSSQVIEFNQDITDANVIKSVPLTHDEIKKFAQKRCPFNHMTVVYKRDIILSLGGYHHHLFMEDYNLWLRVIGNNYKVANLPDVLLYARVGNGMHARRKGFQYIKSEKQLLDLKKQLKLQKPLYANMLFLIRSAFRLLPANMLGKIYNTFLRKDIKK